MNEQIAGLPVSFDACSLALNPRRLLASNLSIETRTEGIQFSDIERIAMLTQSYLQLNIPLEDALRAAEADLSPASCDSGSARLPGSCA